MGSTSAIDIASPCPGWNQVCPDVEQLADAAAQLALRYAPRVVGLEPLTRIELGITLADDDKLQRLNRDYRGKNVPTNVLAFPAWEVGTRPTSGAPLLLGDIVLGFETVVREAAEQRKPVAHHLSHMIVHGVLHLLGYDHRTEAEADAMEALEMSILAGLGIPDPYCDTTLP